jgi:hypothetical protein
MSYPWQPSLETFLEAAARDQCPLPPSLLHPCAHSSRHQVSRPPIRLMSYPWQPSRWHSWRRRPGTSSLQPLPLLHPSPHSSRHQVSRLLFGLMSHPWQPSLWHSWRRWPETSAPSSSSTPSPMSSLPMPPGYWATFFCIRTVLQAAAKWVAFLETLVRDQRPFLLFHSFTHVRTPHANRLLDHFLLLKSCPPSWRPSRWHS